MLLSEASALNHVSALHGAAVQVYECLQACAGLIQILRDSSSAGVAFCRTLADRAISGDDQNISVQSVSAFAVDLADYLASCTIKIAPEKSKAKDAKSQGVKPPDEGSAEAIEPPEAGVTVHAKLQAHKRILQY